MKKILFTFLFIIMISSISFAVESTRNQSTMIDVSCPHAILIDMDTGRVLYQKSAYEATYPASTTKILTAILTLENCNLDDMVTASRTAVTSVYAGGTTANIQPRRNFIC